MGIGSFFKSVGGFFANHWDDIAIGVATGVAFAAAGPVGAGLVGGVLGGVQAGFRDGWSVKNVLIGAGVGAATSAFGGGIGKGVKGAMFAKGSIRDAAKLELKNDAGKAVTAFGRRNNALWKVPTGTVRGTIPSKLGGAHLAGWKTYAGMAGSALAGYGGRGVRDQVNAQINGNGPQLDAAEIKVKSIGNGSPATAPA